MKEIITAYLRDPTKPISLENIDFDSALEIRRAKEKQQNFEFKEYNWKDESVEVLIERPNPPKEIKPPPRSQEEWEEKRAWYMKHAGNCPKLLMEGLCEGYIIEDSSTGGGIDEVCGDLGGAVTDMQNEDDPFRDYFDEDLYGNITYKKSREEQGKKPKEFLQGVKRLSYKRIQKIRSFRQTIYSGKPWTNAQFIELGFTLPDFTNIAEENGYILNSLDDFIRAVGRWPSNSRRSALSGLVKQLGLNKSLVNEARQNPWEVYKTLKETYCSPARNSGEYDERIGEVLLALNV